MASMDSAEPALITHHPAVDDTRARIEMPVAKVTLLEDRAQIRRTGKVTVASGHNRLALYGVSPVVQDVSLRVEIVGAAKVLDARVRRAIRVGHREKPEAASDLEKRIDDLARGHREEAEEQNRANERAAVVVDMMHK